MATYSSNQILLYTTVPYPYIYDPSNIPPQFYFYVKLLEDINYRFVAFQPNNDNTILSSPSNLTITGIPAFGNFFQNVSRDLFKSIVVGNTISSVEPGAFSDCYYLTDLSFNENTYLTEIPESICESCYSLINVYLSNSITRIKGRAFSKCSSLTNISLSSSLTTIDNEVFVENYSLPKIVIPNNTTTVGDRVFSQCFNLTELYMNSNITSIGTDIFYIYSNTQKYIYTDQINNYIFTYFSTNYFDIFNVYVINRLNLYFIVDQSNNTVYDGVIYNVVTSNPKQLVSSIAVTSISQKAFYNKPTLTEVFIPYTITSIGSYAFANSCNISYIKFNLKLILCEF